MKRAERAVRRQSIITITPRDICPPERLILREAVPECPLPPAPVVDVDLHRWRFTDGQLTTYIRYVPPEERVSGDIPWAAYWSA